MKPVSVYRKIGSIALAILLSFSLSFLLNSTVNAQGRGGNRGPVNSEVRLNRAMAYWTQQLSLTTQQQTQFKAVLQQHFGKQDSLRGIYRGNRQAMQGQMLTVRNATHAKLAQILTSDQQQKFVPLWGQRGKMMNGNGRNWNN